MLLGYPPARLPVYLAQILAYTIGICSKHRSIKVKIIYHSSKICIFTFGFFFFFFFIYPVAIYPNRGGGRFDPNLWLFVRSAKNHLIHRLQHSWLFLDMSFKGHLTFYFGCTLISVLFRYFLTPSFEGHRTSGIPGLMRKKIILVN